VSDESPLKPPEPSRGDAVYAGVRGAVGAVPLFGSAAVEFLNGVLPSRYERRRDQWMHAVYEALTHLLDESQIRALETNESFLSALASAIPAVLRAHQEEKLKALRNAVINAAAVDPEDDRAQIFIRYVDELTPGHVRLLATMLELSDELYRVKSHHDLMVRLSPGIVPEISWADDFRVRLQDLQTRMLVRISPSLEELDDVFRENLVTTQVGERTERPMVRVTHVGRAFLEFIGDPVEWRLRKAARGEEPSP
jgi:hypothetical protein